jgi:glycogen debranching enzyme
MKKDVIEEAYEKALETMRMNVTPIGFSASTEKSENYYSVWSRDHSVCTLAACMTGDASLIGTAKRGVIYLLSKQIDHGQVPSYVEIENKRRVYGGLGSITSVDSNMWIIIAAAHLYRKTGDRRFISDVNLARYNKLYSLFKAFDSNYCGFLEIPRAGDWADMFNRTYHVLYDECLHYWAFRDLLFLFREGLKRTKSQKIIYNSKRNIRGLKKRTAMIRKKLNSYMWFTKERIPRILEEYMIHGNIEERNYDYYQSHLMPFKLYWSKRFDSFGNVLAMSTGIANAAKRRKIIRYVVANGINRPVPIRCLYPPVYKNEKEWEPIYRIKERPHIYHNGGAWPVIAGFWVHALMKSGRPKLALSETRRLAAHLRRHKWRFNEYTNGKTGMPMGKAQQAWSAAGYIIAYHAIRGDTGILA